MMQVTLSDQPHTEHADRIGVFVCGSGFSGSSAVTDWLCDSSAFYYIPGQEIKAVGRGAIGLLNFRGAKKRRGLYQAKRALYPDPSSWSDVHLNSGWLRTSWRSPADIEDMIYTAVSDIARTCLNRVVKLNTKEPAETKLSAALGKPFLEDHEFRIKVNDFAIACERNPHMNDEIVMDKFSSIISHFHDAWRENGIPVFDNIIFRSNIRYIKHIGSPQFKRKLVFFVYRDPRDQYAEIVKGNYLPLLRLRKFCESYKRVLTVASQEENKQNDTTMWIAIPFEDFLLNDKNLRIRIEKHISDFLKYEIPLEPAKGPLFHPIISNVGKWKTILARRQARTLENELGQFFNHLAD